MFGDYPLMVLIDVKLVEVCLPIGDNRLAVLPINRLEIVDGILIRLSKH